jgi:hypothetical protein
MHSTDASTSVNSLYVLGARQRNLLFRTEQEWNLYESALILRVDLDTGTAESCVEYKSPPEARASDDSSIVFKSGTLAGGILYVCTSTEVLIFKPPGFRRLGYISLPSFNDLHHVAPAHDGNLLIANTGLDMVLKITRAGEVQQEWSVLDESPWSRFSRGVDYRKVETTKPHQSHPNYVFELEEKVWVTRFHQRDAICLEDRAKRIPIEVQQPHDGLLVGEGLYFTTVDGKIIIANPKTLQVERLIDLRTFSNDKTLLGWCRGLLPLDERRIWVGFTRVRKTRFKENILWAKTLLSEGAVESPTHIALYDPADNRCLREIDLEPYGMNIVFSIFPASRAAGAGSP